MNGYQEYVDQAVTHYRDLLLNQLARAEHMSKEAPPEKKNKPLLRE